ncbi:MAG: 30S ribosomal protein S7 [Bacteroidetes bacterium]|nr:30S ribosomal protein S7 [Bacteroidota bacterium]
MRKGSPKKRYLQGDPRYNDPSITKFVNCLMKSGKKNLAFSIFYGAIDLVTEKSGEAGLDIYKKALNNIIPMLEVKRKRIGGATIQVPIEVRASRKSALGIRWLIEASRGRGEHTMKERLAAEIISAAAGEGNAVKKRTGVHKMAASNKAFSHFKF